MSDELEDLQRAIAKLTAGKSKADDAHHRALMVALNGVQAALTELVAQREDTPTQQEKTNAAIDAAEVIAEALAGLRLEVPPIELRPEFKVPELRPMFTLPEMKPSFTLPEMKPTFKFDVPAAPGWTRAYITFDYNKDGVLTGAAIDKE